MLQCPKETHRLHQFKHNGKLYVADLDECQVLEIDSLIWDILELCSVSTTAQLLETLQGTYGESEILQALEFLSEFERMGLLFSKREVPLNPQKDKDRLKLFIPEEEKGFIRDITGIAGGGIVAAHYIINALKKYADVYVVSDEEGELFSGIYGESLNLDEILSAPTKFIQRGYDGIFTWHFLDQRLLSLFRFVEVPIVSRIYSPRGRGGELINAILQTYTMMREFDAFITPVESVKHFYSRFVMDNDCFEVVPNGVDAELFQPMDKHFAKRKVAELLGRPEIAEKPVIGFLSRFQPEKGAGLYLQVAELNPDWIFLAVAPHMGVYALRELPSNFIYAGPQPRHQLPLFFNTFDVHCFPSVIGEEAFGNAVLEAMACGTPPVVPSLAGLPEVVADAGVVVEAQSFGDEIGSFAGSVSPEALSEAINGLIRDAEGRLKLGNTARQRALTFTWDKTARRILQVFKRLNAVRQRQCKANFSIAFAPYMDGAKNQWHYKSMLFNLNWQEEKPLMHPVYDQTVEEGIALSLQRGHTWHQLEFLLRHITGNNQRAWDILHRVKGFVRSAS